MKILLINDYATPTGGAELVTLALRDGLRARGHDARVFASSAGGCGFADYTCFGTTSRWRTLLQTANPWAWWKLRRVLKEFQPDVVHVRMFLTQLSPLILPPLRRVPSLYHVAWLRPICPQGSKMLPDGSLCQSPAGCVCYRQGCVPKRDWLPLMFQLWLWKRWRSAFKAIVANSDATRKHLVREGIEPVSVIWNGTPVRPIPAALAITPTVVFAGRLVREKGVDVLLEAFAAVVKIIPAARLIVAGEGPERTADKASFLGHLSHADMEREFAGAWVQVVPSRCADSFPNVALQAMMRGTAVVASRIGGLPEIVRDEATGLLVPPGDATALADGLVRILQDRALAERFGREGYAVACRDFAEARWLEHFIALYEKLCHND